MSIRRKLRPYLVHFRHVGVTKADVLLSSYPRSGSTWLRFMLFELLCGKEADFDKVNETLPYVGDHRGAPALVPGGGRLIKTHEMHRTPAHKTLYLVRDIRSVFPSMFKQQKRSGYAGDIDAFLREFLRGQASPFGTWWKHADYWLSSFGPNVRLLRFEDMRAEPEAALRIAVEHFGLEVVSGDIERAVRSNQLQRMRLKEGTASSAAILNRRSDLPFVGAGDTNAWRKELTEEQVGRLEAVAGPMMTKLGYDLASTTSG